MMCEFIIFVVFILGGSCSLAGTWWCKNKKKKKNADEPQSSKQQSQPHLSLLLEH